MALLSQSWSLLKAAVFSFIEDEALTRGAAIAFYTATSLAPVLLIVIAIAGLLLLKVRLHRSSANLWVAKPPSFCRLPLLAPTANHQVS